MNTTNKDPYKAPEIYRRYYIQYYEGIQRYLLQLYVRETVVKKA